MTYLLLKTSHYSDNTLGFIFQAMNFEGTAKSNNLPFVFSDVHTPFIMLYISVMALSSLFSGWKNSFLFVQLNHIYQS